ncbi:MAG TPA: hypothetical protein VNA04_08170 [Thermoanaerobaculia bacterium]|nr:hypothetical protein [Thermoanaerobaculia bacterium]
MLRRALVMSLAAAALVVAPAGAVSDHYRFGGDAVIDSPVTGSVQVFGGSAYINSVVDGEVLVIGGNVIFSGAGRVTGNVIHGGGRVMGGENRVAGRIYPLATIEGAAASLARSAAVVALLLLWLAAAVVLTLAAGREIRFSSVEVRASALYCFAVGLVAVTSFVLTAIVFSYLIPYLAGGPLLAALAAFAILTKVYGMVAVFHAVGSLVAGAKTREQLASRKWLRGDLAMVVIGLLILGALRMIPFAGAVIWSAASIFGVGAALATKFGRREPWFLAWRPAEA